MTTELVSVKNYLLINIYISNIFLRLKDFQHTLIVVLIFIRKQM